MWANYGAEVYLLSNGLRWYIRELRSLVSNSDLAEMYRNEMDSS